VAWTLASGATNGTYVLTIAATAPAADAVRSCHDYINTASVGVVGADSQSANDTVTVTDCTGRLIIEKMNHDGNQTDAFSGTYTGPDSGAFSGLTPSNDITKDVAPGDYTVHEDAVNGYIYLGYTLGSCTPEPQVERLQALVVDESITEGDPKVTVNEGDDAIVCLHNQAVGKLVINKTDQVGNHGTTWHFTVTGPDGVNQTITGSGTVTLDNLPVGGSYSVTEDEANTGTCPVPNEGNVFHTTIVNPGSQTITVAGQTITFTFINQDCDRVLSTGNLVINKYGDLNGNHVLDGGESGIAGWSFTVTGPEFPGGQNFITNASGAIVIAGIKTGTYTITEASNPAYIVVGSVDANGFHAGSTTASGDVAYSQTTTVDFYNQPKVNIHVTKTELTAGQGAPGAGWMVTLTGCGQNLSTSTDANGHANFNNLPLCANYVVSENTASKTGFTPVTPAVVNVAATTAGQTYNVSFTNGKITVCTTNCGGTPTPTPTTTTTPTTTPTSTPTTATATPTTAVPNTTTPTPTITEDTLGEKTPGPGAKSTPIAPSTGSGFFGGNGGSTNVMLALLGILALSGGLATLAFGRNKRS
jgi:hypothetical protein